MLNHSDPRNDMAHYGESAINELYLHILLFVIANTHFFMEVNTCYYYQYSLSQATYFLRGTAWIFISL